MRLIDLLTKAGLASLLPQPKARSGYVSSGAARKETKPGAGARYGAAQPGTGSRSGDRDDSMAVTARNSVVANIDIQGIADDSRQVRPGFLFAGIPGTHVSGAAFVPQAIAAGAEAILLPAGTKLEKVREKVSFIAKEDIPILVTENIRRDLARLASVFYEKSPPVIVAITGTNGKTSVASFVRQFWSLHGSQAASLGTLGLQTAERQISGSLTTPGPVALHKILSDLADEGVSHLALEASSHGLSQHRLDGISLSGAAFTNLSRDHLDYHETFDAYRRAKARIFEELLPAGGLAVLNADSNECSYFSSICESRKHLLLTYGKHERADLRLVRNELRPDGQKAALNIGGREIEINLNLVGEFQLMNILCAALLSLAGRETLPAGGDELAAALENILQRTAAIVPVAGRMQLVEGHPDAAGIYIDYAHTPDALETALKALRPHTQGRLLCLFGCGGDRDRGKRPIMGAVAACLADMAIITDDNPRGENPASIRKDIKSGAPGALEIFPRDKAIAECCAMLTGGDILLIAGKGHEQGQTIGDVTHPFDDVFFAQEAVVNLCHKR